MNARFCLIFCVLASCSARPSAPIPVTSERAVLLPNGMAVLASGQSYDGIPSAITFGSTSGRSALYLRFPAEWRSGSTPRRAFIALDPRADASPLAEPVRIEAWRVQNDWRPEALHRWSDKPELAPPYAATTISPSASGTVRIDVTELLGFAANNPELDHGIALIATGGRGHGAAFATGMNGGNAPRLEIYSR